jgi:hypothetical protein
MPKLNAVGIAVASLAFFFIGFIWYGFIFAKLWMAANGLTEEDAGNPAWMIGGLVITVMQVVGLALTLKWRGVANTGEAVQTAVILWALLALAFCGYAFVYLPAHDATLLAIDGGHLLVGWVAAAAILSRFK